MRLDQIAYLLGTASFTLILGFVGLSQTAKAFRGAMTGEIKVRATWVDRRNEPVAFRIAMAASMTIAAVMLPLAVLLGCVYVADVIRQDGLPVPPQSVTDAPVRGWR